MSLITKKIVLLLSLSLSVTLYSYAQFTSKWDNGFKLESEDKNFKFKFGGRIQYDFAYLSQSDSLTSQFGEITHGSEFRRARLFNEGIIFNNVGYKFQVDFAGGNIVFKDVYLEILDIPVVGTFRVGQFKEPIRLGSLTSSNYITFMERANYDSFSEDRNSGMMLRNSYNDEKFAWQLGGFRNSNATGDNPASNDEINVTGRISSLILNNKEKKEFLHLGIGASYRNPKFNNYIIRVRPEAHLAPRYLTTNIIEDVKNASIANFELAYSRGPFAFQSEYLQLKIDTKIQSSSPTVAYKLNAYYAQVSYFLTGEQRPYKGSYEGFTRVKPNKNMGKGIGSGAWEVALRYSSVYLNDKGLDGGTMNDITFGLNWFLNSATIIKFNYVYSFMSEENIVHIAEMRFQVDF